MNLDSNFAQADRIDTSGRARSERQRILNRDFLRDISRQSANSFSGYCTGAPDECEQLESKFLDWILLKFEPITLSFVPDEKGGATLVNNQVQYATLSPTEYSTVLNSAPSFEYQSVETESESETQEGEEGEEGTQSTDASSEDNSGTISDTIVWNLSGAEPIPTEIEMFISDDILYDISIDLDWYQNTPVENSGTSYLVNLTYPVFGYFEGKIKNIREIEEDTRNEAICISGQAKVPLVAGNTEKLKKGGAFQSDFTVFRDLDSSRRCRNDFGVSWTASPGHFFYVTSKTHSTSLYSKKKRQGESSSFNRHAKNIDSAGIPQAITYLQVTGYGNGDSGTTDDTCGGIVTAKFQQYPNICLPYLIEGYID